MKRIVFRLLLVVILLSLIIIKVFNVQVASPLTSKDPFMAITMEGIRTGKPLSRIDGCVVGEVAAKVHGGENGEKNYEEALIQLVNDDNTVQVQTFDTKLVLLFEPKRPDCFRKGSMAPVTIADCKKDKKGECDFSLPHTVYVRTELVEVLNWKYRNAP